MQKEFIERLSELRRADLCCPACQSPHFIKHGMINSTQRYKCKQCRRSFRESSGTTYHKLHRKDKIEKYMSCLLSGTSLTKAAEQCGICLHTSFRWRHRFLSAMQSTSSYETRTFDTVSVIDIPYSQKGSRTPVKGPFKPVKNLVATGADGYTVNIASTRPQLQAMRLRCANYLPSKIIPRSVSRNLNQPKRKIKHLRAEAAEAKASISVWLFKFRGVATKYLPNYWAWLARIQDIEAGHREQWQMLKSCKMPPVL
jgi:transposase-like protein